MRTRKLAASGEWLFSSEPETLKIQALRVAGIASAFIRRSGGASSGHSSDLAFSPNISYFGILRCVSSENAAFTARPIAVVAAGLTSNSNTGARSQSRTDTAPSNTSASAPSTSHLTKSGRGTRPSRTSRSRQSTGTSYRRFDGSGRVVQSAKLAMLASHGTTNDALARLAASATGSNSVLPSWLTVLTRQGRTTGLGSKAQTRPDGPTSRDSRTVCRPKYAPTSRATSPCFTNRRITTLSAGSGRTPSNRSVQNALRRSRKTVAPSIATGTACRCRMNRAANWVRRTDPRRRHPIARTSSAATRAAPRGFAVPGLKSPASHRNVRAAGCAAR